MDIIKKQIQESEQETSEFLQEEASQNISDILAKQKQKERGFYVA